MSCHHLLKPTIMSTPMRDGLAPTDAQRSVSVVGVIACLLGCLFAIDLYAAEPDVNLNTGSSTTENGYSTLFNGQDLTGWVGNPKVWSVADHLIVGSIDGGEARNEFLATTTHHRDFDLSLEFKLVIQGGGANSGIQYRSEVQANTTNFNMIGYQADIGTGYTGSIYDQARRNRTLVNPDAALMKRIEHPGEWNTYRIHCHGLRSELFINGEKTVDFTETESAIGVEGLFGIQLQTDTGGKATVYVRNVRIHDLPPEALPERPAPPPFDRLGPTLTPPPTLPPFAGGRFVPAPHEVVVFTGPENGVVELRSGWIETMLTSAHKDDHLLFRHMEWEGDTVYRQNRMMNWGSWQDNFAAVGATTIVAWFGQMEALDPTHTVDDFIAAYGRLLDEFSRRTPRIVLLTPPPFEKPSDPRVSDDTPTNAKLARYVEAIRHLAAQRGLACIDVFTPLSTRPAGSPALTRDGVHLNELGDRAVASAIAQQLNLSPRGLEDEALCAAVREKNRLWMDAWRCMNYPFAYGDRTDTAFAGQSANSPRLVAFVERIHPLVARADAVIEARLTGAPLPAPVTGEPSRPDPPAETPQEEMSHFKLRDGFTANLFADESLGVQRALQMRWDERGRLWVLCAPSYPIPQLGEHANDYLLILEDTTGSGHADKVTRFAEGLTMPMGFEFADGGVYVCESSQVIFLRDATGAGKATERRVVLSGFGTGDTHQDINSIRWEPDGCLWFTQGYHIWSYVETPDGICELNRSGIWRFNPRTLHLQSFLNENGAGWNCWGVAFDNFGQVFLGSGADTYLFWTTPAMIDTLHPLLLPTNLAFSEGKSMEPEFLHSSHLPDDLQGVLLKSTYYTSQVALYRLHDKDCGFSSDDMGTLIRSDNNDFRPVETRVGPDGAIYICDWINPVIGHYQAAYRDPKRDRSHGRIWRLTANGRPLVTRPKLDTMTASQLIAEMSSPERFVRDHAQQLLFRRPKAQVIPAADAALAKEDGASAPSALMLYGLSGVFLAHEEVRPAVIDRLLANSDFRWRAWATRLIGLWADHLPNTAALLTRSIADPQSRVRLEAVVAASHLKEPDAVLIATRALDLPMDPVLEYAVTQAIYALAPIWQNGLLQGKLDFTGRSIALQRVLITLGGDKALGMIREQIAHGTLTTASREALIGVLIEAGNPDDLRMALDQPTPRIVDALAAAARHDANHRPSGDLGAAIAKLLTSPDHAVVAAAYHLLCAWKLQDQAPRCRATALDESADPADRSAALEAFAELSGAAAHELLLQLSDKPGPVRITALGALAPLDTPEAAKRVATLLVASTKLDQVGALMHPLLRISTGPEVLAQALTAAKPDPATARLVLRWMAENGHDEAPLHDALNAISGLAAHKGYDPARLAQMVALANTQGDAKRGKAIFLTQAPCLGCHKLGEVGGNLGPPLTSIGNAKSLSEITEVVLWPSRARKEGFLKTSVTLKDGTQAEGFRRAETPEHFVLHNPYTNQDVTITRADVAKLEDGNYMTEAVTAALSDAQLADLLRFLSEQRY